MTPHQMRARSRRDLALLMADGRRFDPLALAGWVYRGTTLGLPSLVERLTWIKFAKAFQRAPEAGLVRGWNIRVEQDALDRPWRPRMREGEPVTFGDFVVTTGDAGVVLDYRVERGPLRVLRDPVVALDASADVLLGRSLLQLGPTAIPTPAYFLLERDHQVAFVRSAASCSSSPNVKTSSR